MVLYKLFSSSVEIQYKSCLFSVATLFTMITTSLNIVLPMLIAYNSRGLWLKNHHFYEQPSVRFKYEYILIANTDDPSSPIVCGDIPSTITHEDENCSIFQVLEVDGNEDGLTDILDVKVRLNTHRSILSLTLMLHLDFELKTVCPLQMQTLAIINKEFSFPSSSLTYMADLNVHQISPLPCYRNHLDLKYNHSLLEREYEGGLVDGMMLDYFNREVTTRLSNVYSKSHYGLLSTFELSAKLRVPQQSIRYKPSFLQEFKWAWPQYLSLVIVFYWIFNKLKFYVFNNGLIMAWEIVPWNNRNN